MALKLNWPFKYKVLKVASDGKFGRLKDFDFYWKNGKKVPLPHQGSDYRIPCGIPFYSPVAGKVDILETNNFGYGYFVRIKFSNKNIGFAHNSKLVVKRGQTIKKGQLLGYTGYTGAGSGCHSHIEYRINGKVVNPETMIEWGEVVDMFTDKSGIFKIKGKPITLSANGWNASAVRYYRDYRKATTSIINLNKDKVILKENITSLKITVSQQTAQLKTLVGQVTGLQTDLKKALATMDKQSGIIDDLREDIKQCKELAKMPPKGRQKPQKLIIKATDSWFIKWGKKILNGWGVS